MIRLLIFLAIRNAFRQKRRTVLTLMTLAFGVCFFMFTVALFKGNGQQSLENLIAFETGHFRLQNPDYDADNPFQLTDLVSGPQDVYTRLEQVPFVTAVTGRLIVNGSLDNGVDQWPITAVGIDVARDRAVFNLLDFVSEGAFQEEGALLGAYLAESLGIGVGDFVYFTFRTQQGMLDSIELEVTGLVESVDPQVNYSSLYLSLALLQTWVQTRSVTSVHGRVREYQQFDAYTAQLQSFFSDLRVQHWRRLGDYLVQFQKADQAGAYVFIYFMAIIAVIGLINTMVMSVYEKKVEIGVYRALGLQSRHIQGMIVFEGMFIGFMGGVVGLVLGSLVTWYFVVHGIDFTSFMADTHVISVGYKVMGVVKLRWDIGSMVLAFVFSIVVSGLASLYPARKATRLVVTDCLKVIQ